LSRPNKAGAEQQIALRSLIGDVKHTIAELAAAEGRLLSIGELFGRAWQLGRLLAARKEPVDHGKSMIRYRRIFASSAKRIPPIDALDSKSRNHRFYLSTCREKPFTIFTVKLSLFA